MSQNPFDQHSFSVPRFPHRCNFPGCHFPASEGTMLCSLHDAPHRPRRSGEDDGGDE